MLNQDAVDAIVAWQAILSFSPFCISMVQPQTLPDQATADATGNMDSAGLGGVAFFPDGSCVWFQLRISLPEAKAHKIYSFGAIPATLGPGMYQED